MQVAEIMTEASVTDTAGDTLRAAAATMWAQQTGSLVVVEPEGMVGIITERDVLRAVARGDDVDVVTVGEVMTSEVVTCPPDMPVRDAARLMAQHWIRHLPVLEDGRVAGVVSQRDVVGVFAALWREPDAPVIDTDGLVRARRLARIEHGDLD